MGVYEYKTVIRYQDISEENKLSDKGVLTIFAEAAGSHAESIGNGLNYTEKTGYAWMLLYWKVRILKRPAWNTEVIVKTWVRDFDRVSSWRDSEMYDENEELIAIGTAKWVFIDTKSQKLAKITEEMVNEYGKIAKNVFNEELSGKLQESENLQKVYEYIPERRDIDVNHHVNNIIYLELAYNAFPENIKPEFDSFEIFYKKQIKLGETISVCYREEDNIHTVSIKSKDEKILHAVLKFYDNSQL